MGKDEEGRKAAEAKRREAQACYLREAGQTAVLSDLSTRDEVEAAAVALKRAMTGTLDEYARKNWWFRRSKPWWTSEIKGLRKELGRARRERGPAGIGRQQEARRDRRRTIRRENRDCSGPVPAGYTAPRIDKAGQVLVAENGSTAEGRHDRKQAILQAHFPQGPPGRYEPKEGGSAFRRVSTQLVG